MTIWIQDQKGTVKNFKEDDVEHIALFGDASIMELGDLTGPCIIIRVDELSSVLWAGDSDTGERVLHFIWQAILEQQEQARVFVSIPAILAQIDEVEVEEEGQRPGAGVVAHLWVWHDDEGELCVETSTLQRAGAVQAVRCAGNSLEDAIAMVERELHGRAGLIAVGDKAVRWDDIRDAYNNA